MRQTTVVDRIRYQFDNTMSKGTAALIGWLFAASGIMIVAVSLLVLATGIAPASDTSGSPDFIELMWMGLMRSMDSGAVGGDGGSWWFRLAMLAITLGGIFIFSTLIGVLSNGINTKLEQLRKGRSFVIEQDHTVILGWSPQVFSVISELVLANASRPRSCIVILAEQDKVEMEDQIRAKVGSTGRTRIVCRTGSPIDLADLEIVNPHRSRSLIILAPDDNDPDSAVIKTILAITNNPQRRKEPYHIVAEMRNARNMEIARMVGRSEVQLVPLNDLISRITVQTCLRSGLSMVYTDLLDFGGDEIYFKEEPQLAGKTFGEALLAYDTSSLIGIHPAGRAPTLNPPMDTRIQPGDRMIVIAEDDHTIKLSELSDHAVTRGAIRNNVPHPQQPDLTLILGWNQRALTIISELDNYVVPGSEVSVVAASVEAAAETSALSGRLRNLRLSYHNGDTTDRDVLDGLEITRYHHVIVLGYSDSMPPQDADSLTLMTLLHLRDISEREAHTFSIVSEMLESRNRELAEVTRADDFIVSDRLVSLMLAQVSENKDLAAVFEDLFDPAGSELYLKPASDYVEPNTPLNFYTVVESARARGEVAIGYRKRGNAGGATNGQGLRLNPAKSQTISLGVDDQLIVLAGS
jgi:voltage-gated potassium channel Kch